MGFAPNFDSFPTLYGLLVPRRGRRHELQERGKGSAMPSVWQIGELTGSAAIASKSSVLIPPQRKAYTSHALPSHVNTPTLFRVAGAIS